MIQTVELQNAVFQSEFLRVEDCQALPHPLFLWMRHLALRHPLSLQKKQNQLLIYICETTTHEKKRIFDGLKFIKYRHTLFPCINAVTQLVAMSHYTNLIKSKKIPSQCKYIRDPSAHIGVHIITSSLESEGLQVQQKKIQKDKSGGAF
jgi:hypothetical protein